jgi:hypothetical protein
VRRKERIEREMRQVKKRIGRRIAAVCQPRVG